METFESLRARIRKWAAAGVTHEQIATKLRIHAREVKEIASAKPAWNPQPDEIAAATAAIRAQWSEADWRAAAKLLR